MDPIQQSIHYKLASWCMETKGSDRFHQVEAIQTLMADLDSCPDYPENRGEVEGCKSYSEKILRDALGKDYEQAMKRFNEEAALTAAVKAFYDQVSRENINKQMIYDKPFILYRRNLMKLSLVETTIPKIFCILLKATSLQKKKIPSQYFGMEKRKPKSPAQKQEKQSTIPDGAMVTDLDSGEISQL